MEITSSLIKRVSCHSNFKNVCKTAARKHQFWLCYKLVSGSLLHPTLEVSSTGDSLPLGNEPDHVQIEFFRIAPSFTQETIVKHPKWVKLQSSYICFGVFVCIKYDPIYGKVIDIIVVEETVILCQSVRWFVF